MSDARPWSNYKTMVQWTSVQLNALLKELYMAHHPRRDDVSIINVVVAIHNKDNRAAYMDLLRPESGVQVVGWAGTSQEVIKAMQLKPRILVLERQIMTVSVIPLLPTIRLLSPKTQVILLTGRITQQQIADAILQGARGVLRKSLAMTYMGKAIRLVEKGEVWIPRTIVPLLLPLIGRIGPTRTRLKQTRKTEP